jgi:hypothetical protein
MTTDAIALVTQRLRDRLAGIGAPGDPRPISVYVGPPDDKDASSSDLALFLFRIAPSAPNRNTERRLPPRAGEQTPRTPASLPLDLYFLLTTASPDTGGEPLSLERLGLAMARVEARPVLEGSELPDQVVRLSLEPSSSEELSRIWSLFPGTNYRTSLVYLATPVWVDWLDEVPTAAPVVTDRRRTGQRAGEGP